MVTITLNLPWQRLTDLKIYVSMTMNCKKKFLYTIIYFKYKNLKINVFFLKKSQIFLVTKKQTRIIN